MKYITSVEGINFQAHKDARFDFSNFTAIVGPSNKGKTSIVRLIKWVLYNEPAGNKFIRKGESLCKGTVNFSDGTKITRTRSRDGSVNSYDVFLSDGSDIHLEGFGFGAPEEVLRAHGMRKIDLFGDKQSLNVCEQLQAPFFLGETPTMKAVMLGQIAKTDVIDLSIKNAASTIRSKKAKQKEYKAELKEVKGELSDLKGLAVMEKAIDYADKRIEKMEYIEAKITNIQAATQKLSECTTKKETLAQLIESKQDVTDSIEVIDKAIEICTQIDRIKVLNDRLTKYMTKKEELSNVLNNANKDDIDCVLKNIDEMIESAQNINTIKEKVYKIQSLEKQKERFCNLPLKSEIEEVLQQIDASIEITETISKIKPVNSKLKQSLTRKEQGSKVIRQIKNEQESAINAYTNELANAKVCPTCMGAIDDIQIHKIKENM